MLSRYPSWPRALRAPIWLVVPLMVSTCAEPPEPPTVRGLLARGTAHAEIDQWAEARELFQRAIDLDPGESTAAYDLALAGFRSGDRSAASEWIARARENAPPELAARIELLRAKLAYEEGDASQELEAHRAAAQLAPREAAYAFALAQLHLRRGEADAHGEALSTAYQLSPDNTFLAAELALWALAQPDPEHRRRGFEILEPLAGPGASEELRAYLEKGHRELAVSSGVPTSLRIAVNLLRATKRFQSNATELQSRLEVSPIATLTASADPTHQVLQPPAVSFENAPLVPAPDLAAGEKLLAAALVDDSVEARAPGPREAGIALLSDRGLYSLATHDKVFQRLADAPPGARQLLAGDVDDDERMEILIPGTAGLVMWARDAAGVWSESSLDPELAAASDWRQGLLIDFEHDGDLDLLAVDRDGHLVLSTHRGEAGFGPPRPSGLPVNTEIRHLAASDLDADADQDLLLLSASELLILRNWRQGDYTLQVRLPLPRGEQPSGLLTLDYDADSHMDVVVLLHRGFDFWRGDGRAGLSRDQDARADTLSFSDKIRPGHLTAADLDLDGDYDLVVAGTATTPQGAGLVALFNDGHGRFGTPMDLIAEPWPAARGALVLDLDGDRDPDLLSWAEDGLLRSFRGQGAEGQSWLALRLRAPPNKAPRDGRGVRLQVVSGDRTQWLEPRRPNVILGLGRARPALIKATWPNGISEYLFEPAAETEHTLMLSMRVEGSCPFLYASDGHELRFVTDILGLSPVGMLAAAGRYVAADPEEYLRLPDWVRPRRDVLELAITEELREALYLDQAELVAVDAPAETEIYNGEQWLPEEVQGLELRLMTPLVPPTSVSDDRGREVLDVVRHRDDRYLTNHTGENRYQGAVAPHRLTIELPPAVAAAERPALVLVGWLHWGNTSTNVARSQDPAGHPMFPLLEVPDSVGGWRRTATPVGLPAGKTKPVVVDLSGIVDPADPRLRLTTDFEVYWDRIAVASLLPDAAPHRVNRVPPQSAELRWRGFSRWFRPAPNGPYLFDYGDRRDYPWRVDDAGREIVLSWQELEGFYTAYGPVRDLLEQADDRSAVIASGEEILLRFDLASLPPLPAGWHRTFFLHSEGWEKDGDPNVSCSRTVEPLPYRGMTDDPCSGLLGEPRSPTAAEAPRSRWVGRDRLPRRVASRIVPMPGETRP